MNSTKNEIKKFVTSFDEASRQKWNDEKEWWEPVVYFDDSEYYEGQNVSWLCDHLGDAQDAMEAMWCEILRLRRAKNQDVVDVKEKNPNGTLMESDQQTTKKQNTPCYCSCHANKHSKPMKDGICHVCGCILE